MPRDVHCSASQRYVRCRSFVSLLFWRGALEKIHCWGCWFLHRQVVKSFAHLLQFPFFGGEKGCYFVLHLAPISCFTQVWVSDDWYVIHLILSWCPSFVGDHELTNFIQFSKIFPVALVENPRHPNATETLPFWRSWAWSYVHALLAERRAMDLWSLIKDDPYRSGKLPSNWPGG